MMTYELDVALLMVVCCCLGLMMTAEAVQMMVAANMRLLVKLMMNEVQNLNCLEWLQNLLSRTHL